MIKKCEGKNKHVIIGKILSPDCLTANSGYVVIEGNKIQKIAYDKVSKKDYEENTCVTDFGDALIMPGFHDVHTHILQGTLMEEGGILRDAKSEEEAAKMLYDKISNMKYDYFWVLGGAWDHFKWEGRKLPSKESLDKYFPDKPVFLLNKECHGAWVNSKALEYFDITKDTPNPSHGEIFKNEIGEPSGYLHEDAALNVISYIFDVSDFEHLALVEKFSERTVELGITAVSDMQLYNIMKYRGFEELEKRGKLKTRVHFCPPITESIGKLVYLKKMYSSEKVQFSGVKGFVDGTPMGYTGLMIDDYEGMEGFKGKALFEENELFERVKVLEQNGIRCRLHACGDGGVRLALRAFEYAKKENGFENMRHTIEHFECMKPEDGKYFQEMEIIASVQPDHMPKYEFENHPFHEILGPERINTAWPFKTIQEAGGILSFGTDYPIAPLNPMRGIFRAVTRLTDDGEPKEGFIPEEKLSMTEALRAYTLGSAYCNFREKELGTIEEGKLADIVVLDKNLLECNVNEIMETKVLMTIFDGEVVYDKGSS